MKIRQWLIGITTGLTLFASGTGAATANASKTNYINAFPKSMRGTWYYYDKYAGKVTTTVTKYKMVSKATKHPKENDAVAYLHYYKNHNPLKVSKGEAKKTVNWVYGFNLSKKVHGYKWINLQGWDETAGDGTYMSVTTLNHRKVLTFAGGAGVWVDQHTYKSAKVAKQLQKQKYPKFKYYSDN